MSAPEQEGGVFQSSDSSQSGGEASSDVVAIDASGTAAAVKKEPPLWYGWILWSLPIWWPFTYVNFACKSIGTALYFFVTADFLDCIFLLFFPFAYVISLCVIKVGVRTHLYTLVIWIVLEMSLSAFVGFSPGNTPIRLAWAQAAGCPREKALEYVGAEPRGRRW